MLRNKGAALILMLLLSLVIVTFPNIVPIRAAEENSWTTMEPMQQARSGLSVATVNGKIYAIGGTTTSGFAPSIPGLAVLGDNNIGGHVGTNEEYDPETDTWTFKTPMPTPRIAFATAVYRNRIYCIGGKTSDGFVGVNEVYDPATDTWETKTSMPTARGWLTANVVGDKIYLIDGYPNETLNEVYDPATDTWTTKSSLLTASAWGTISTVFDNKIYVLDSHLQIYDPEVDTWSYGSSPPSSVGSGGVAVATTGVLAPKQIYTIGVPLALSQEAPLYSNQAYDPAEDNWTVAADSPIKRYNFGAAVINDLIYVIGGHTHSWIPGNFAPNATTIQYTPIGYGAPDPSYVPPDTVAPAIEVFLPENGTYGAEVPLNFTVSEEVCGMSYSLDGQDLVPIHGNTTLSRLSSGVHNITVFAEDAAGNVGTSAAIAFKITGPELPITTLVGIVSGISIMAVALVFVIYFRKAKHPKTSESVNDIQR